MARTIRAAGTSSTLPSKAFGARMGSTDTSHVWEGGHPAATGQREGQRPACPSTELSVACFAMPQPCPRTDCRVTSAVLFLATIVVAFVVVGLVDSAAARPQSTSSIPPPSSLPSPANLPTERQERKLDLEIRKLEEETSTGARVRSWLPAGSTLAALAAGAFGAYQYFRDRRRESAIRVEEQFSDNLQTIAEYVHEANYPSAGLLSALTSLKELVELTKDPQRYRSRVTS